MQNDRKLRKLYAIVVWMTTLMLLLSNAVTETPDGTWEPLNFSDSRNWAYCGTADGENATDVFFIAPSVFGGKGGSYLMDLNNEKGRNNFVGAINMEKGIYDKNTRFYAPFYRQAGYNVYGLPEKEAEPLKQSAYADIKDAFIYYLEHLNDGRPFILAGFSQGADMAIRLMKDFFGEESLQKKLVACYAIGWRLTEEETNIWPQIRPAQGETDIGVIVTFNTEAEKVTESAFIPSGMKSLSINPLNWKTDGEMAEKTLNQGACFTNYEGEIQEEIPALTGAYLDTERGALKVTDIDPEVYNATIPILSPGVYHLYDYQFFYRNLQQNVQDRIQAYRHEQTASEPLILNRIREAGVLRVGTAGDYKPMSFFDPETGTYWGFDTELAEDLAASLGVETEYVLTSWPTLTEDTLAGKFDLAICGITITDARKEQALMSEGYLQNGKTVLCRAEDANRYASLEAVNQPGVRVMETPGGLNEIFARENLPDAILIIHDVNQEIPGLIASGEADVMITEVMEAGYYAGQDSRLAAPLIYEPFTDGQIGVLIPKGSEDLLEYMNGFLDAEKANGRLEELADKYIYRLILTEKELQPAA